MSEESIALTALIVTLLFSLFCAAVVVYLVWLLIKALRKYLREEPKEKAFTNTSN